MALTGSGSVGASDVRTLSAAVESMRALARSTGGYVPALAALGGDGEALARRARRPDVRKAALGVATAAYTLAGWSAFDGLQRAKAWEHYDRALLTAREAGDRVAIGEVLRYSGVMEAEAGRHNEALRLFQLADIQLMDAPPSAARDAMRAGAAANASTSYAAVDRAHIARSELSRAEDTADDLLPFERADLLWRESETYAAMGQYDRAHELAERSLGAWPAGSQRDALKAEITIAGLHRRTGESDAHAMIAGCRERVEQTSSQRARWRLAAAEGLL